MRKVLEISLKTTIYNWCEKLTKYYISNNDDYTSEEEEENLKPNPVEKNLIKGITVFLESTLDLKIGKIGAQTYGS